MVEGFVGVLLGDGGGPDFPRGTMAWITLETHYAPGVVQGDRGFCHETGSGRLR